MKISDKYRSINKKLSARYYLIIQHLSGPRGARLKEFYCLKQTIIIKLQHNKQLSFLNKQKYLGGGGEKKKKKIAWTAICQFITR
jgi:hypothetical protein